MNAATSEQVESFARTRAGVTIRAGAEVREEVATLLAFQQFGLFYGTFQALKEISLEIPAQRITAIIGPSGCGKSTLLRSINRMNDLKGNVRTEGSIMLDGRNIADPLLDVIMLRRRIGMVFQKPNPFPLSIFDNVAYGLRRERLARPEVSARVEECLRRAALWDEVKDKLRQPAMSLSGGQQQRLCIARAIAVEPEVLLMDEPASALDPIATIKVEDLMLDLRQHYTIVLVTHNMQQAGRVADFTAFMLADEQRAGRLIEFGPTLQIFSHPRNRRTEEYITGRFG